MMLEISETERRFMKTFELSETQWAGLGTFSVKEMVDKTSDQRRTIEQNMDATKGGYDFDEANLMMSLGREDRARMAKSLANVPLSRLMAAAYPELGLKLRTAEFLAKSGTTGIQGAAYLIPDKIHQVLFESAVETDLVEWLSINVIPAEQIPGATLKVDIEKDDSFEPYRYSSGGKLPENEITTEQATLDFTQPWGVNFAIANDLIEDSQFDMIEFHLRQAGREFGEYATNEACTVLKTATDGDGTKNSSATGDSAETKWTGATTADFEDALIANTIDGYHSNRLVMSLGAMLHSVYSTVPNYSEPWIGTILANGWPGRIGPLEVRYSEVDTLTNDKAGTELVTCIFSKEYSLLSGRKRWLRIENYSDPVRDLVGAVITARQDSVTIYNDSIYVLTETA